jgi:ABC-type uncharacterized transport system permease subunit
MQKQIWLKRVLIPFWVIQLIFLAALFIIACFGLSEVDELDDYYGGDSTYYSSFKHAFKSGSSAS